MHPALHVPEAGSSQIVLSTFEGDTYPDRTSNRLNPTIDFLKPALGTLEPLARHTSPWAEGLNFGALAFGIRFWGILCS